jgi:hypothetical protein
MSTDTQIPSNHRLAERQLVKFVRSGYLQIDENGVVWRVGRRCGLKAGGAFVVPVQKRLASKKLPSGYIQIRVMVDNTRIVGAAHRLVWQWFNGDIPVGREINHKNGIKDDNRPCNLEVVSPSENRRHAYSIGLSDEHGEDNPSAKLSDNEVVQIRIAYASGDFTIADLARRFGVCYRTASKVVKGFLRPKQPGPLQCGRRRNKTCENGPNGRFMRKTAKY